MDDSYVCKKCHTPIEDIAAGMLQGCSCGCRVFLKASTVKDQVTQSSPTSDETEVDDQIAIKVRCSGIYQVNLKNLLERESDGDPLFIEDQRGKINVIFNPDS